MSENKFFTVEQIKKVFSEESPRFLCLQNSAGLFECSWNNNKVTPAQKFKEIIATLNKKNLAPGVYYYIQKNSIAKKHKVAEHKFPIIVGNVDPETVSVNPLPVTMSEPEIIWTAQEAVKILSEKNRLELENIQLRKEVEELQNELAEFEKLEELAEQQPQVKPDSIIEGIQKLITTVAPTIDKFMNQRERMIQIEENKSQGNKLNGSQVNTYPIRDDGGIHPADPDYLSYIDKVMNCQDDETINSELDYLEKFQPEIYKAVCQKYGVKFKTE